MKSISYLSPCWFGTGLTNQMLFIILGIINAYKNGEKLLVIDKFRLEPLRDDMCPISEVIDIHHLNRLISNLNVTIMDRKDLTSTLNINKILYGAENSFFDITDEIISKFYTNNELKIPNRFDLNQIKGDPITGIRKILKIQFQINEKQYEDEYDEYLFDGVNIDLNAPRQVSSWDEVDQAIKKERSLFTYLLKNIKFVNKYYNLLQNLILINKNNEYVHINDLNINANSSNRKINVIHLRLEKDMTHNMSKHNNTDEKTFIDLLEKKYIGLIENYLNKDDILIILSYELDNNVIKYLKDNGYDFYFTKKNMFKWREPHAILDILLSEYCTGTFIGNWQHHKSSQMGSTFSFAIDTRIREKVNKVFIDLYDITKTEMVIS